MKRSLVIAPLALALFAAPAVSSVDSNLAPRVLRPAPAEAHQPFPQRCGPGFIWFESHGAAAPGTRETFMVDAMYDKRTNQICAITRRVNAAHGVSGRTVTRVGVNGTRRVVRQDHDTTHYTLPAIVTANPKGCAHISGGAVYRGRMASINPTLVCAR